MSQNKEQLVAELEALTEQLYELTSSFREDDNLLNKKELAEIFETISEINALKSKVIEKKFEEKQLLGESSGSEEIPIEYENIGNELSESIGDGKSKNNEADLLLVKGWLKNWGYKINESSSLDEVITAIMEFQVKMGIKPDGIITPSKNTWKYLSGTPIDLTGVGVAEDETEAKLFEFQEEFTDIKVCINPKAAIPIYAEVQPPYTNKNNKAMEEAKANRDKNPKVHALIRKFGLSDARATIPQMIEFMEKSIELGYVKVDETNLEKSSIALREYLIMYGIGADCFGAVAQANNFLEHDTFEYQEGEDRYFNLGGSQGLGDKYNTKYYKELSIAEIKAGDVMFMPEEGNPSRHARMITDVDITTTSIVFTTVESSSGGSGNGGNIVIWRYDEADNFKQLWRSKTNGVSWEKDKTIIQYIRRI